MRLKESCVSDCWKLSSVVPVSKNVGESSTAKNYRPVSLLCVVSKVLEKLVHNRIVDHLEKCAFFLIFSICLGLFDELQILFCPIVLSNRTARAFNRSGASPFFINKKFKRLPRKSLIFKQFLNNLPGRTKGEH